MKARTVQEDVIVIVTQNTIEKTLKYISFLLLCLAPAFNAVPDLYFCGKVILFPLYLPSICLARFSRLYKMQR